MLIIKNTVLFYSFVVVIFRCRMVWPAPSNIAPSLKLQISRLCRACFDSMFFMFCIPKSTLLTTMIESAIAVCVAAATVTDDGVC